MAIFQINLLLLPEALESRRCQSFREIFCVFLKLRSRVGAQFREKSSASSFNIGCYHEGAANRVLRKVGISLTDYTVSHSTRPST